MQAELLTGAQIVDDHPHAWGLRCGHFDGISAIVESHAYLRSWVPIRVHIRPVALLRIATHLPFPLPFSPSGVPWNQHKNDDPQHCKRCGQDHRKTRESRALQRDGMNPEPTLRMPRVGRNVLNSDGMHGLAPPICRQDAPSTATVYVIPITSGRDLDHSAIVSKTVN
jgi:hypothetical protein